MKKILEYLRYVFWIEKKYVIESESVYNADSTPIPVFEKPIGIEVVADGIFPMNAEEVVVSSRLVEYGADSGVVGHGHSLPTYKNPPSEPKPKTKQNLNTKYNPNVVRGANGRFKSKKR